VSARVQRTGTVSQSEQRNGGHQPPSGPPVRYHNHPMAALAKPDVKGRMSGCGSFEDGALTVSLEIHVSQKQSNRIPPNLLTAQQVSCAAR
jgi:hypothetical protein